MGAATDPVPHLREVGLCGSHARGRRADATRPGARRGARRFHLMQL